MKRLIAAVCIFVFALAGCSGSKPEAGKSLTDFEVVLEWYRNAVHSFIYEAIEKGYYAEEGLNVIIRFPANTNDALSLTAAGKADVGIYYMHDMIRARADQNVPVKAIGTVVQKPLNIFLSLSGIDSPEELIGKRIGQSGSDLSEATIRIMVENAGGTMDDVEVVDVGFDLMSSMTTGNVDATLGCMVNHEVPELVNEGFDVSYFYPSDYGLPNYYELIFVAGDESIAENGDRLAAFLRASAKGFEDMKRNPEEAVKIMLDNQNEENFPLKENVEMASIEMLLPAMETEVSKFLWQDAAVWDENIDWMLEEGILQNEITAEDVLANVLK